MKNLYLLTVLIFISLFSCSTNDDVLPDDESFGVFDVSIAGDLTKTMKGDAAFVHGILTSKSLEENGSVLSVLLTNDEDSDEIITILLGQIGNLNGVKSGTYKVDLEPEDGDLVVSASAFLAGNNLYLNTSGEVKITSITNSKANGSLNIVLTDLSENSISISGTFEALGVTKNL